MDGLAPATAQGQYGHKPAPARVGGAFADWRGRVARHAPAGILWGVSGLLDVDSRDVRLGASSLAALVRAVTAAAGSARASDALRALAEAARAVSGTEIALIRALDDDGERLEAVAVAAPRAFAAELYGTVLPAEELPQAPLDDLARAPAAVRRIAERAGATHLLLVPVRTSGCAVSVELLRSGEPFDAEQRLAAELCAAQAALVLRAFAVDGDVSALARPALELAGEALAVASEEEDAAAEVVRLAAGVAGASAVVLWESREGGLVSAASWGVDAAADLGAARGVAERALAEPGPISAHAAGLPRNCAVSTTLPLGRPPLGVLQLFHPAGEKPGADQLTRLATFGVRIAHALRTGERARQLALELERTQTLLEVFVQATAELSVSHTLETTLERVAELLSVDRVAVYLRATADGELEEAASRSLAGPHARVADRLLDVALGPSRERAVLEVSDVQRDPRLAVVAATARETGISSALAVPLTARGDVVGLLAAYPEGSPAAGERETALLAALAGQLTVAVQNAQLHEQATRLGEEREAALAAERAAARRIRALYEVSVSFAQSLRLDETLDALARTVVELLDIDAAVVRMPDERGEQLVSRAVDVRDAPVGEAVRAILTQPVPFGQRNVQRLFRERRAFRLGRDSGEQFLPALVPFLEKGWTAAMVPVAVPTEVVASLGIFSFRPGNPLSQETVESATALAGQAALAIDNARLYQQQKQFADTMQRSLLPRSRPVVEGLEVGEVYEPSARVDVGGDVYDFLVLEDGRLAVVLGDVTGHGVDATADMAMAKFVFRSLAREHREPTDFLASANDVICSEIGPGKFISMSYVVVDGATGSVAAASAGHPAPRIVLPGGVTQPLEAHGLVLGIDGGQEYAESHANLQFGASLVLYTDGVIEARRNGELYGGDRLDALLAGCHKLPARALAAAVAEDAREFAGGDLSDDLAVVVIRKT
jgi:serine phosphatase RsbU (regulator of sigma subunit)